MSYEQLNAKFKAAHEHYHRETGLSIDGRTCMFRMQCGRTIWRPMLHDWLAKVGE